MRRLAIGLLACLLLATGCVSTRPKAVLAEGLEVLPASSAVAWVTYADHLVEITILDEQRVEPTPDEIEAGEGMIPRVVRASVVRTWWSRPGTKEVAPTVLVWNSGG